MWKWLLKGSASSIIASGAPEVGLGERSAAGGPPSLHAEYRYGILENCPGHPELAGVVLCLEKGMT